MNIYKLSKFGLAILLSLTLLSSTNAALAISVPNPPTIYVWPIDDLIYGFEWSLGAIITMTIEDLDTPASPDYTAITTCAPSDFGNHDPLVQFHLKDLFDIHPGQTITMTDGVTTRTHTVKNLTLSKVDTFVDTISGITDPGVEVFVNVFRQGEWVHRWVTADNNGIWAADFSVVGNDPNEQTTTDIKNGDSGQVGWGDSWGSTVIDWNLPSITAFPIYYTSFPSNQVFGSNWMSGSTVTLSIDDPSNGPGWDYTDSQVPVSIYEECWAGNQLCFDINADVFQLQPGHIIRLANDVFTIEHIVTNLRILWVDYDTDTVGGIADPGSQITIFAHHQNPHVWMGRIVTTDQMGNWVANYAIPGNGEYEQVFDLQPTDFFIPKQSDQDGNLTKIWWQPPNPALFVVPNDPNSDPRNIILGQDFEAGTTVDLCIDNPPFDSECEYADSLTVPSEPNGFAGYQFQFSVDPSTFQVTAGQRVQFDNGLHTEQHIVTNLHLLWVDWDTDTVGGTADPGDMIAVPAAGDDQYVNRWVTADNAGNWIADFAHPGSRPDEQDTLDLRLGHVFFIPEQVDENGNSTKFWWQPPNPRIGARATDDSVEGWQWIENTTVTIEIDDPGTPEAIDYTGQTDVSISDWNPDETWFGLNFNGEYDLKPGDTITVTDGLTIKTHVVTNLAFDEINPNTDTVFGHASPNSQVNVWVCDDNGCVNREETSNPSGDWQTNFSISGDLDWEQDTMDIQPGTWVDSSQNDEDGDGTYFGRNAGSTLSGTVYLLETAPENVMAGVMVEACTTNNFCRITLTNGSGDYWLDNLPAGIYNIRAIPPGSNLPGNLGPIDVNYDEILYGQDVIVSEPPLPPPPDAVIPAHPGGGTVVVYWKNDLTLTTHGCTNGTATFKLTVLDDGYIVTGPMTESPAGSGTYTAEMPALYPHHGVAWIEFMIACPGGGVQVAAPFPIYIDPSGVVKNTKGEPIPDATVILYYSQTPDGPFTQVRDGSLRMSPSNRKNPDTTDENGQFGWDVVAGFYKVRVEKAGCYAPGDPLTAFVESAILTIPPPVTDLELILECPAPFPTTSVLDAFDRPNGSLGSNWKGSVSYYRIVSKQVDVRSNGPIYWKYAFGVNQEAYVTITNVDPAGKEQDLLLKVQGSSSPNWGSGVIEVLYNPSTGSVTVWTFRPDTLKWYKYPALPATFASGDQFGAQALATGEVVIFRNGMEVGRVTLNSADQKFFNSRGGYVGLWFINANNAFFDDFGGGNIKMP